LVVVMNAIQSDTQFCRTMHIGAEKHFFAPIPFLQS
jgi:hypothetical protein